MVVLVVTGILAALTVPPLMTVLRTSRTELAINEVAISLRSARSKAVSQGNNFVWTWDGVAKTYQALDDNDNDGAADVGEALYGPSPLPSDLAIVSATLPASVTFRSLGNASSGGVVNFADGEGGIIRLTVEAATGMVSVSEHLPAAVEVDIDPMS
jgi:Tfp pilus assembly protein FimT